MKDKITAAQARAGTLTAEITSVIPYLRVYALGLCGNRTLADDLVSEAIEKGWAARESFIEGTNLKAWLATILRNCYFTEHRKRRLEIADPDSEKAGSIAIPEAQTSHMDFRDFSMALQELEPEQREAMILIFVWGYSYEDAAKLCGCKTGTIKSRVSRGRDRLAELLGLDPSEQGDVERRSDRNREGFGARGGITRRRSRASAKPDSAVNPGAAAAGERADGGTAMRRGSKSQIRRKRSD